MKTELEVAKALARLDMTDLYQYVESKLCGNWWDFVFLFNVVPTHAALLAHKNKDELLRFTQARDLISCFGSGGLYAKSGEIRSWVRKLHDNKAFHRIVAEDATQRGFHWKPHGCTIDITERRRHEPHQHDDLLGASR
jgi:hypothetical protein